MLQNRKTQSSNNEPHGPEDGREENTRHILIVEDDWVSVYYLKELLNTMQFDEVDIQLHSVSTGEEAIEYCIEHPVDLILMDIKLPVMDGFEATQRIKSMNPGITIIAQTAYVLSGDRQKAIDAGCDDYISKPIPEKLLLELLNKYL